MEQHDPLVEQEDKEYPPGFFDDAPKPLFWRVLILPIRPKEVSKGGIVLAQSNLEAQRILNYIGKVVALGPTAGVHERLGGDGKNPAPDFPKVGDYVIYGRYAGQAIRFKDCHTILVNDDEILGTVPNPDLLKASV